MHLCEHNTNTIDFATSAVTTTTIADIDVQGYEGIAIPVVPLVPGFTGCTGCDDADATRR